MSIRRAIEYALSLPERAVRSVSAAVGGTSKLMTDTLLPRPLRRTRLYQAVLGNTQRFLIESLGDVKSGAPADGAPGDDFLARKVAGSIADTAALVAFHFSPMWFFAFLGDAAGGTKEYLARVVTELKRDGALPGGASIASAEELLDALSQAAAKTQVPFDAPPLSRADLAKLRTEINAGYGALYAKSKAALPSPEALWKALMEVRRRDAVSLLSLSGAMALAGAKAAGRAAGGLFYERVLLSYAGSLDAVRREGYAAFFVREARPYVAAVGGAFAPGRRTFTERLLGSIGGGR